MYHETSTPTTSVYYEGMHGDYRWFRQYELTKTGKITYSHPEGTHNDRFWALALYAAEKEAPPPAKPKAFTA